MKLLNLDQIVDDDKIVELGGVEYFIPSDINLEAILKITKTAQKIEENPSDENVMNDAIQAVYDIFQIRDNDLTYEDFKKSIGLKQYTVLVQFIMGQIEDAEKKPIADEASGEPSDKTQPETE